MRRMRLLGRRTCIAVTLAAGLLLSAGQCQRPDDAGVGQDPDGTLRVGTAEASDTVTRGVAPGDRTLVIDGYRGAVDLQGTGAETAELTFTKRGRGGTPETAQEVLGDVSITESGTAEAYTYEITSDDRELTAVDVSGTVPAATTLRLTKNSGSVDVEGVTGPLTVRHQYGDVRVRGAAADLEVNVQTGDVEARFRRVPTNATITLRTANGDVTLALPPDASVQVDAQTNAGAVRTQGLTFGAQKLTPANAGARYTAQIGSAAAVVEINTENGDVTLTAAEPDTTAQPASVPDTTGTTPPDTTGSDTTAVSRDTVQTPRADTTAAPDTTAATDTTAASPSDG